MKIFLPLFFLFAALPLMASSTGNGDFTIAIIDLEGVGADINQCSIASDKIRNILLKSAIFKVMERDMMQEILREQGFQQTGACNSTSCIVEAGQLLGVRYLLAGRLSRTEGLIAISLRVIDVKTGLVLSSDGFESNQDYPYFISRELEPFTKNFIEATRNAIEESREKGSIFIDSKPVSGKIIIDGNATSSLTPATINNLTPGTHEINVRASDLIGHAQVEVKKNDLLKILIELNKGFGSLIVQTTPPNATVKIEDLKLTDTPVKKDSIPAGKYQIQVSKNGYVPVIDDIDISPNILTTRVYNLVPCGYIKLSGVDSTTLIQLDENTAVSDSSGLIVVWAGTHTIKINKPDNEPIMKSFSLEGGDTLGIILDWKPLKGYLSISTAAEKALIKIANNSITITPVIISTPIENLPITSGNLLITLFNKKYTPIEREIYLKPGQSYIVTDTFTSFSEDYLVWKTSIQKARTLDLIFSGLGDITVKTVPRGSGLLTLGLVSDGLFGISVYQYFSHKNRYGSSRLPEERQYYNERISDDKYWAVGTFTFSVVLRLLSFYLTSNIRY
jgi:TolB-like protein